MHVEVRLVINMKLQRVDQPSRLMFTVFDYSDEHGPPVAVVYLGKDQSFMGEHYSTLEEDLEAIPRPPSFSRAH